MIADCNFIAIDVETATYNRASICEVGICIVRNGAIVKTQSWLVQPYNNYYSYQNTRIHGISARDTINAPLFDEVWQQVAQYIKETPLLVAHNAAFDMSCIRSSLQAYEVQQDSFEYYCTLQIARRMYKLPCNKLNILCEHFGIPYGNHHRAGNDAEMCARLFLQELHDSGCHSLHELQVASKWL